MEEIRKPVSSVELNHGAATVSLNSDGTIAFNVSVEQFSESVAAHYALLEKDIPVSYCLVLDITCPGNYKCACFGTLKHKDIKALYEKGVLQNTVFSNDQLDKIKEIRA